MGRQVLRVQGKSIPKWGHPGHRQGAGEGGGGRGGGSRWQATKLSSYTLLTPTHIPLLCRPPRTAWAAALATKSTLQPL